MNLEGQKVISATEMARIEKASIEGGASADAYMQKAGNAIAHHIKAFKIDQITLLVGKGNNGGDAFVAGCALLEQKYAVHALTCFEKSVCSPLCQKYWQRFLELGGVIVDTMPTEGLILDGLLGTGFNGEVKEPILSVIKAANASELPIVSVDIPSGLCGNTGKVSNHAIVADYTCFLGMPKVGFFLGDGMNHIGTLAGCDFGLPESFADNARAEGYLLNEEILPSLLPPMKRTRHKYEAGYIVALAGSPGMPGAAMMSCMAAYRTGAGIIRLFHPEGMDSEFASGPKELVRSTWSSQSYELLLQEKKRAQALLIGPGLGRTQEVRNVMDKLIENLDVPSVIDADGLYWLAKAKRVFSTPVILTPHYKEMKELLAGEPSLKACQLYANEVNATVVLKGAPTWIFHPNSPPLIMDRGCPGLATAGTGDVLAGILAALLAQGLKGREAASLGTWLHALCGELVSLDKTDYGMVATDLIEALPEVLAEILSE